jgi:hypothetical protein
MLKKQIKCGGIQQIVFGEFNLERINISSIIFYI